MINLRIGKGDKMILFKLFSFLFVLSGMNVLYSQARPNILLICTDDQGYHDVSYYGTKDLRTPNIDSIIYNGIRFDNFYANSSVCSPTRAALLTGRYQGNVGVPGVIRTSEDDNWGYLSPKATLLSQRLKDEGYNTAIVGKWHLGLESPNLPNERGFDYFKGWLGDMMDDYWKHRRHGINYMYENNNVIDPKGHATELFTDWAIDYIGRQNKKKPFFLYLAYNAPHFPVQPPDSWLNRVYEREGNIDNARAKLVAFIEHMDHGIGKVIESLKTNELFSNTIIVFTSDNGGHLPSKANNGPLRGGKQSMYEGGLKVPTGISWKGKIRSGRVSRTNHMSMDLFPTILRAAGVTYDIEGIEGVGFFEELINEEYKVDRNREFYFSRREGGTSYGGQTIVAIRKGDWKLLQNNPFQSYELYNLANDPLESNNVIETEFEKFKELNILLMKNIQLEGQVPWQK
ncbi:sulfatase [Joostella sp.]|uniref:sulfatase family protein n=1 Tax=Joostella sp. TaxID=2231138 RepID=UPI003A9424F5